MDRPLECGMQETRHPPLPRNLPDALDEHAVARAMAPQARRRFDLHVVASTGSTNADLMARHGDLPSGYVLAAETQTAGRGRRGRTWHSAAGASLTFSLLWRFAGGAATLSGLSLATGLGVARALDRCGAVGVMLKWPNDLLARRTPGWAKLGGILIEIAAGTSGPATAVIGIGLNVRPGSNAPAVDQAVTDLAGLGATVPRNQLLACMLEDLACVLDQFEISGFAPRVAAWNARHAFRDQPVALTAEVGEPVYAIARGANPDGALMIDTANGPTLIFNGEVSLRLTQHRHGP
jgi:BirA family biotin operon repressor/biotin-[acetyl-CoA-carboxylase] ligase